MTPLTSHRPLIFVTNDDGFQAPGLRYLINCVASDANVIAVAPDTPQSGKSSAITVDGPLHITPRDITDSLKIYSVSGTPVDCVKLGIHTLLPRRPDLLISGINHGSNSACNLIYSGTMGAVIEGAMLGIPSIGYSLLDHSIGADFSYCVEIIKHINARVLACGMPADVCLNVNIPANGRPDGIKVVRGARGHWSDEYTRYTDPHGHDFYWLSGSFINDEPNNKDTDNYWLDRNYATAVPVRPDQSYVTAIESIRKILE